MLPLAVPGLILAAGYVRHDGRRRRGPLEARSARRPTSNPFVHPGDRLRGAAAAVRGARRLGRPAAGARVRWRRPPATWARRGADGLRRITLPLIAANLIAAGVLTFAFAMLEVSDSLILAQTQNVLPDHQANLRPGHQPASPDAATRPPPWACTAWSCWAARWPWRSALLGKRLGAIFRA